MSLWWKLSVEWPAKLGDFLFWLVAVWPVEWVDRLTWRFFLNLAVLLLAFTALRQILPPEVIFVLAGDTATYVEIVSAALLLSARGRASAVKMLMRLQAVRAARLLQSLGRSTRVRLGTAYVRAKTRIARKMLPGKSDDETGWAFV